ncbi:MAG TPA: hypothetical protein VMU46_16605 [Burkholderiales bacterium]|nr:hypothetical protein [Burkholderiales bacterium]
MSKVAARAVTHGTFVIERELPYPPSRVFAAWADPKAKAQWFAAPKNVAKEVIRGQGTRGLVENLAKYLQS